EPRLIARSTVSRGMFACRAARTAARSRGLDPGSGRPVRAAVVSSRMILVKTLARFLSCAPFRYMMFLNCEWPAIDFFAALLWLQGRECSQGALAAGLTIQYGRIGASRRRIRAACSPFRGR